MKQTMRQRKSFIVFVGIVLFSLLLAACGSANTGSSTGSNSSTASGNNGKGCKKIGVLLPETATSARWDGYDRPLLEKYIPQELPGAKVDYYNAEGSASEQQTQANSALTKGDCILVIAPSDSQQSAAIVSKAKSQGVPVIAYDRLIYSNDLNYYVSFDGVAVGKLQGQYIVDHYSKFAKNGKANLVMINGSNTDNNALLFNKGAMEVLNPLINNGTFKLVYSVFTPNWDNATAQTEMQAALTKEQNNVQIAYVANDGMANNVIAALKAQKLNGHVLVTGQDATVAGIQNILTGDQSMTVYKPIAKEAMATAQLVAAISNGTDTSTLTNGVTTTVPITGGANIPSILETPIAVDATNIATTVLADGYVTKAQICAGIPAGTDGIC
jgi:D-xylose transport system substrate-binding protein